MRKFYTYTIRLFIICGFVVALAGCRVSKFVPENQYLYTGSQLKLEANDKIPDEKDLKLKLESGIYPKPNKTFLGMYSSVWFYYKAGDPGKKKSLRYFMKYKLGKKPVYLTDADPEKTSKNLRNQLVNNGYFDAVVNYKVVKDKKMAHVNYMATLLTPPYRIKSISYRQIDSVFGRISDIIREESFLKVGDIHKLDNLNKEMDLVEKAVRDRGFYYFNSEYLIFRADSTVGERQVDLFLTLEKNTPPNATKAFSLDTVSIINHYTFTKDSTLSAQYDSLNIKDFHYLYRKQDFRPEIIIKSISLHNDSLYRRYNHELTLRRLTDLGVFKFVNIKFEPIPQSNLLQANIYLTPYLKKSLRFESQFVSKSNNFVGPSVALSFVNRNFLRGAELFQLRVHSGYEVQVSGQSLGKPLTSFELGTEASLAIPRFIVPFPISYNSAEYMPRTNMKLGAKLQNRLNLFQINSFNVALGYNWRETSAKSHELYPIEITYFKRGYISDEFQKLLSADPFLQRSFENQFVLGSRYGFTYNSQTNDGKEKAKDNFYFNGNVDISGNLAFLIGKLSGKQPTSDQPLELFNSPYSQYSRLDANLRYYHDFNKNSQFAFRLIAGTGFAYGNSSSMPYIKQFSAGGSNSLRAFRARSVGPGSFNAFTQIGDTTQRVFFIDQTGDVKLESTAEYRFGIWGYLKGAVFVDAGNIWLLHNDPNRPGADFSWKTFANEINIGTGAGLRMDLNYFVLRFDAAFPLRKAYLTDEKHWVIKNIDFLSPEWRKSNLILNIAIGYPF